MWMGCAAEKNLPSPRMLVSAGKLITTSSDSIDDVLDDFVRHARMNRQADVFLEQFLCDRAFAGTVAHFAVHSREVNRHVVRPCLDPLFRQQLPHEIFL